MKKTFNPAPPLFLLAWVRWHFAVVFPVRDRFAPAGVRRRERDHLNVTDAYTPGMSPGWCCAISFRTNATGADNAVWKLQPELHYGSQLHPVEDGTLYGCTTRKGR